MSEAEAPESGALSVEQAIAQLNEHDDDTPSAESASQATADTQSEGATSAPDDTASGAETPALEGPEGEASEPAETPLDPPLYWKPDAKAKFAALDRELQAEILAQEGPREEATAKVKAQAAELSQQAQAELGKVQQLATALTERLPQWVQNFQNRWGTQTPDWTAYAAEHGTERMVLAKTQFEGERQQLAEAAQATRFAETQAHEQYVKTEFERLKEVAPDLADPEKGGERRTEVTKYLQGLGIPNDALVKISATEMSIARKAMLWDQAQTKAKSTPLAPKPQPSRQPLTRGAAALGAQDPKAKQAQTAKNRFSQTRSIEHAIALLNAQDD